MSTTRMCCWRRNCLKSTVGVVFDWRADVTRALPDPTDRNDPGDERLFDAVVCLLVEQGARLVAAALRPDEVTDRAGKARASYYRTAGFPRTPGVGGDTRRAVLVDALDRSLRESAGDLDQMVGGVAAFLDGDDVEPVPVEMIRSLAAENFTDMVNSPHFYLQLLAAALSPSADELQASLQRFYATVAAEYDELFRTVLDHWGYRPRPPFGYHDLTVLLSAIGEGLGLRHAGVRSIDGDYYADVLGMVLPGVLVPIAASTEVSRVDLGRPAAAAAAAGGPPTRSAITSAALRLFGGSRVTVPTLDEVARAAGCSAEAVVSAFGGLAGVVSAAWDEWSPEFVERVSVDRSALRRPDPLTVLYRLAIRVAVRGLEHQQLVRALVIAEISTPSPAPVDTVTGLFETLLGEAVGSGEFNPPGRDTPGRRVARFAAMLRRTLLVEVPTTADIAAVEVSARQLVDYVWAVTMPAGRPAGRHD
ncbi:MAG: hypothetical protein RI958_2037 [Actinomycetota bacterium]